MAITLRLDKVIANHKISLNGLVYQMLTFQK